MSGIQMVKKCQVFKWRLKHQVYTWGFEYLTFGITDHSAIGHIHDLNTEQIHYTEHTTSIFETNIRYIRFKVAFLMSEN